MPPEFISFVNREEFLHLLNTGNKYFENGIIVGKLSEEQLKGNFFKNVKFDSWQTGIITDQDSTFINCTFSHCTLEKLAFDGQTNPQAEFAITIDECKIETLEFIKVGAAKIEIENGEFNELEISNAKIEKLNIQLKENASDIHLSIIDSAVSDGKIKGYIGITLRDSHLQNLTLSIQSGAFNFENVTFTDVAFQHCKLKDGHFYQCTFADSPKGNRIVDSTIDNASFDYCKISWRFNGASFSGNSLYSCNFNKSIFTGPADLTNNKFTNCDLSDSRFNSDINLSGSNLEGTALSNTSFKKCNLADVNLMRVVVNQSTNFIDCTVPGLIIQQKTILGLRNNGWQSFSKEARMDMQIKDDLTTLKLEFSGPYMWLHLLSVVAWLTPYFIFLAIQGLKSQVNIPSPLSKTILCKFFHFIQHGQFAFPGSNVVFGLIFLFLLSYNVNRIILLLRVLNMETKERFKGIPVEIDLQKKGWLRFQWRFNHGAYKYAVAISLLSLLAFLFRTVPF